MKLDFDAESKEDLNEKQKAFCLACYDVVHSAAGKIMMEFMVETFLKGPVVINDSMAQSGLREGERNNIRRILGASEMHISKIKNTK